MNELLNKLENGEIEISNYINLIFKQSKSLEALESIKSRSYSLDKELSEAVCVNSDELLRSASAVKILRDQVISLKNQISNARLQTEQIALSIINPFNQIKNSTNDLDVTYQASQKLRTLLRFLSLYRQTYKIQSFTKIPGANNDIKRLIEIYKIGLTNELEGINIYNENWIKIKPLCEKMILTATQQLHSSIQSFDINLCSASLSVFDLLGNLSDICLEIFQKEIIKIKSQTDEKFKKSNNEIFLKNIKEDFNSLIFSINKINTLQKSIINRSVDSNILFDINLIDPLILIKEYLNNLKIILEKLIQKFPDIYLEIPLIRKFYFNLFDKLFNIINLDQLYYFFDLTFKIFIDNYISQFIKEYTLKLNNIFNSKNNLNLFFEDLDKFLLNLDKDLLMKFKIPIFKLFESFYKFKFNNNQNLINEFKKNLNLFLNLISNLSLKFYDNEFNLEINKIFEK